MLIWFMLVVYIILTGYVLWRLMHWLKKVASLFRHPATQTVMIIGYIALAATLLLGGLLPAGRFQILIRKISNYWLCFFSYLLLFMLLADIAVLILKRINRKKKISIIKRKRGLYGIGVLVAGLTLLLTGYGIIHAGDVKTHYYEASIAKEAGDLKNMRIALVADLHLGYSIGVKEVTRMVEQINAAEPDLVIFAGDIFDNNYDALEDPQKLEELLSGIRSRYGVYGVYGNHDVDETLIGGFSIRSSLYAYRDPRMDEFAFQSGITMLEDDVIRVAEDSVYLIGRLDEEKSGDGTSDRMPIGRLLLGVDKEKPIIVVQHEPSNLDSLAKAGVDVTLSGHTHGGQFFPLTIPQPLIWKQHWGYCQVENNNVFVTSGVGIYGPRLRVGTDSEVMVIDLNFQ